MGKFTSEIAMQIVSYPGYEGVDAFIETGTFRGGSASAANNAGIFKDIVTIELSKELHALAVKRFSKTKVQCLLGSSAELLAGVSQQFSRPSFFYLDAHWFSKKYGAGPSVSKEDPFPLWKELEILKVRPYADIIAVDDYHVFGRSGPEIGPEWKDVSLASIIKALDEKREAHSLSTIDQFVVYRKTLS